MKITKQRLKEIIKEELPPGSLNHREAEAYEALANAVGDLVRDALEGSSLGGLSPEAIRDAIGEALAEELGSDDEEESGAEWDERSYQMDLDDRIMDAGHWQKEELQENRTIDLVTAQKLAAKAGVRWSGRHVILMKKHPNTPDGRKAFTAALGR
jgi:hypothetical protein